MQNYHFVCVCVCVCIAIKKVKLLRMPERSGLIRAKVFGAEVRAMEK